ncbi:MAG: sigma factor-like helix-turn-helix DNA-binding protein [Bacteroidota bacterium]
MLNTIEPGGFLEKADNLRALYERYGGMLLGYLTETLQDGEAAGEQLADIFIDLIKQDNNSINYSWQQLHKFARERLAALGLTANRKVSTVPEYVTENKAWRKMTPEQQLVFYNAYHCSRPIDSIAQQLNKPEGYIRRTLVEAFAVIRKS